MGIYKAIIELINKWRDSIIIPVPDVRKLPIQDMAWNELPSCSDIFLRGSLKAEDGGMVLSNILSIPFTNQPDLFACAIADTGSMDGTMDSEHIGICVSPKDTENHKIMLDWLENECDKKFMNICVYAHNGGLVIHRLIRVDLDSHGRNWIFQGDNPISNASPDPWPVRDSQIKWLIGGIIF